MPNLGAMELFIVFAIIVVLFGVGRVSKIGGELGEGIKAFRKGVRDENATKDKTDDELI